MLVYIQGNLGFVLDPSTGTLHVRVMSEDITSVSCSRAARARPTARDRHGKIVAR